ncbi:MAG TPA: BamA/TamA family outer membrane protein, partial [Thermoanaerobaculia bacterium]|nr:BamA/TamA family outer membrane protein [Thermoanaerobaculia bacterium]
GSATPFPHNRIEVLVTAPGSDPASPIQFTDDWLKLVITHEYAHILHLDQARGFSGGMRRVFGRNPLLGFPNAWSPLWLIEGLATLIESETTPAGRLKGTFTDMVLRTAAIENRFATEAQASGLGPYWPTGNARYFYGAKFLSWLATKHGMEKLTEYLNEYSSSVIPFRVNATANDVYGTSMKALWREWSDEQQRAYRAEGERIGALTERTKLTTLGYETKHPILSPDGTRLAYAHRGPYEQATIRVRDVAAGRDVATHAVNAISPLSWSADGKSLAYSDLEFVGSFQLLSDLYAWEIGGEARRITRGARLKDPAFTPDGRTLIAVENRTGRNRLVEVDVASGSIRALVTPDDDRQFGEPAVSRDGTRIAVAEWRNGTTDIVVYSRGGERIANVTQTFARATNASPRFSPDDRTIWFSSDVTGVTNLYAVDANGGEPRRLTNLYGGAFYPTSADGRRFYYSDYSSNGFDLASFDATREHPIVPRTIPATVTGSGPVAENTELPNVSAPATDYSPWQSLRPRWWFPILGSETVSGQDESELVYGFTTSGGDALARHWYEATITNRSHGVLYSYDGLYPTLTFVAQRYDENAAFFLTPEGEVVTYRETTQRFLAQAAVPIRKVQRQLVAWGGVIRDDVGGDIPRPISPIDLERAGVFRGVLQGVRAGVTFNNANQYLFSISPEQGVTVDLAYENLSRALGSDASLQQLRADVRGFLSIPYARSPLGRHVLAARAAGGRNSGDFVLQRELEVGGDVLGSLATLDLTEFPVRGYQSGALRGQTAAIASIEYRFPLWEIDRGPTTLPLFFQRIHGDVFVDAGRAWRQRPQFGNRDTIASTGAEVAFDFIVGNVAPIRLRAGAAYLLRDPARGDVQPYISIGSSF